MSIETLNQALAEYSKAIEELSQCVQGMNAHFERWQKDHPEFFTEEKGNVQ